VKEIRGGGSIQERRKGVGAKSGEEDRFSIERKHEKKMFKGEVGERARAFSGRQTC